MGMGCLLRGGFQGLGFSMAWKTFWRFFHGMENRRGGQPENLTPRRKERKEKKRGAKSWRFTTKVTKITKNRVKMGRKWPNNEPNGAKILENGGRMGQNRFWIETAPLPMPRGSIDGCCNESTGQY